MTSCFLSTLSLRRATRLRCCFQTGPAISIHALLAESDFGTACATPYFFQFLSTLSLRRATITNIQRNGNTDISIHALLAESDSCPLARPFHCHDFYPRSPCGERRQPRAQADRPPPFLSTLSLRRATQYWATRARAAQLFLSTLSLRRATRPCDYTSPQTYISIHALLAESDKVLNTALATHDRFLSTLSLRRATRRNPQDLSLINYFYPRSPCGERRCQAVPLTVVHTFLSTLSLRRATADSNSICAAHILISIHALLAESDPA